MAKIKMTPEEVATFWYNEAQKLQVTIEKLSDELIEKDATIAEMEIKFNETKSLGTKLKLAYGKTYDIQQQLEYYQKRSTSYHDLAHEYRDALKAAQLTIADKDNQIRELTPKMTYEQIIDLKCENARLKEENAKFAKWKQILDKFKIF